MSTIAPAVPLGAGRAGFREALWSEWTKLVTLRSTRSLVAVLGLALPVFSVIVAATGSLQDDDTILGASLLGGAVLAQVVAAVLGAGLITSEFKTGTIRVTLAACPRRLVVLGAKATVAATVAFVVVLVSGAVAYGIGLAMLDQEVYATGEAWPALGGVALAIASISVLGVGIGTVVRHPAGAVSAVIGVVFLPGLLAPLLGGWQRWLGGASLNGVMQKLTQSSDATHDAVGSLGGWPSMGVVAVYTIGFVLAAAWVLRYRDT
jgi:ABC-type transport system involved in multi-copper enzyme maturation permease subunit